MGPRTDHWGMRSTQNPFPDHMPDDLVVEVPDTPAALIEELEAREQGRFEWTWIAVGLVGLLSVLAIVASAFAFAFAGGDSSTAPASAPKPAATPAAAAAPAKAPTLADAKGIKFEKFQAV